MCRSHKHDVVETLVNYPYVGRLTRNEKTMFIDMTKSMVKLKNILLTLKEHNDKNVTTTKHVYTTRTTYQRSFRGPRTEMQYLMYLLERDMYIH